MLQGEKSIRFVAAIIIVLPTYIRLLDGKNKN